MSFFKKLFGRSENPDPSNNAGAALTDEERFDKEVRDLVPRYRCMPGLEFKNEAYSEAGDDAFFPQIFPEAFATWRTVKSRADRRSIIYSALDGFMGNQLKTWQVIERFADDRYPEHALEIAKNNVLLEDLGTAEFWTAVGRTNLILTDYAEAEKHLKQAVDIDPKHKRARVLLADLYHITNRHKEAHALYDVLLVEAMPQGKRKLDITELLGFDANIMHSPVYAMSWLNADTNVTAETWEWAGEEFYYSPHFRAQHAYYLLKINEHLRGLTKLVTLSKEMPWYREGVINAYNLISQLGLDEHLAEDKSRLKALIDKNNWSESGMHSLSL